MGNELAHPRQPGLGLGALLRNGLGPRPAAAPLPALPRPRRREVYTRDQKERAIRLLNNGVPCRQVASLMGPRCSSGTPIRWRQAAQRAQADQRRMEQILARNI